MCSVLREKTKEKRKIEDTAGFGFWILDFDSCGSGGAGGTGDDGGSSSASWHAVSSVVGVVSLVIAGAVAVIG